MDKISHIFYKYKEIIIGTAIGLIVAIADYVADYYVFEEQNYNWTDYFIIHLDIFNIHFIEHFIFLSIGIIIGVMWWRTGSQFRKQISLTKEIEKKSWFNDLLLDIMTHDISNYNQIALGNLYLLKKIDNSNEQVMELLHGINRAVMHSEVLSNNIKVLNKLQSTKIKLEPIFLSSLIKESFDDIKKIHPEVSISFKLDIKYDEKPYPSNAIMKNVFINIFRNMVLYNKSDNETVQIEVSMLHDTIKKVFQINLADQGIGIPDDLKKSVFSRFIRGDHTISGSGLGLSISNRIIETLNGKIWIENRLDSPNDHSAGSLFIIQLPEKK